MERPLSVTATSIYGICSYLVWQRKRESVADALFRQFGDGKTIVEWHVETRLL